MVTRIEQLERQVEVLREALADYAAEYSYSMAGDALAAAARIAAEPVEATDAEVVMGWATCEPEQVDPDSRTITPAGRRRVEYHQSPFGHFVELVNNGVVSSWRGDTAELAYSAAAAWVRAQGGAL